MALGDFICGPNVTSRILLLRAAAFRGARRLASNHLIGISGGLFGCACVKGGEDERNKSRAPVLQIVEFPLCLRLGGRSSVLHAEHNQLRFQRADISGDALPPHLFISAVIRKAALIS